MALPNLFYFFHVSRLQKEKSEELQQEKKKREGKSQFI